MIRFPVYLFLVFHFVAAPARAGTLTDITASGIPSQTHNHSSGLYPAGNAVDGDLTTFNHTESQSPGAAWELHFANEQPVARVEIVTRDCCAGRLNGATMRLFDEEAEIVFEVPVVDGGPLTTFSADLPEGVAARDLRIGFEPGESGIVHLAEVRVFAPAGAPPEIVNFSATEGLLSWEVQDAVTVELQGTGPVSATGSLSVSPDESTVYILRASNECDTVLASAAVIAGGVALPPLISEFAAFPDDWIEIWNPGNTMIDLTGWRLTDDALDPDRWTFSPGTTLAPGALLVVDRPFGLAREADSYLALLDPSGLVVSEFTYPSQFEGSSYGTDLSGETVYFLEPSPGEINDGAVVSGFLEGVDFSVERGHFDSPFTLTLSPKTPGASVLYSIDGSDPHLPASGSFLIETTTVVRAAEYLEGYEPSRSEAHTYIFPNAVSGQAEFPDGFPDAWLPDSATGALAPIPRPSDYEMDPDIVGSAPFTDRQGQTFDIPDALLSLPSLCLTIPVEEMWNAETGLHANALKRGRNWERAASMEIIDPATGTGFHTGCGLRIHGGRGRVAEMLKKSFRLYFRKEYGAGKLDYPLFEGMPGGGVDHLVLRGGNGKTWASPWRDLTGGGNSLPRVTYLRDQFLRDCQRAMGQPGFAGTFVHLYINGLYWGLYNPVERPGGPFAANHFGGDPDSDWDFLKWANGLPTQTVNGDTTAWNEVLTLSGTDPVANYDAVSQRVDIDNLADFLIANFYAGNTDWVGTRNNGYAFRSRLPFGDGKFRFLCWDGEESLLSPGANTTDSGSQNSTTTMELHLDLRPNPEYRIRFADRVHRQLVDEDGVLLTAAATARHDTLVSQIDRAIAAESARWGDLLRPNAPYTRSGDWLSEIANITNNYLTTRPATVLAQLRADGLYPDTTAPVAALDGSRLDLSAPAGDIWFTTDGSDPRLPGGAISPSAQRFDATLTETEIVASGAVWSYLDDGSDLTGTAWTQTDFDDSSWASGPAPLGYGSLSGVMLATTVGYGPDPLNKPVTTWFRHRFHQGNTADPADVFLRLLRDDGAVVYLNGVEIIQSNLPPGPINAATLATAAVAGSDESVVHTFSLSAAALRDGDNILAVQLHQERPNSSDLGFDLALVHVVEGFPLAGDVHLKARALANGVWSALEEETFRLSDPVLDLVISEIMYHPSDPDSNEIAAGYINDDAFEFIEIRNVGSMDILLDGMRFTRGVDATLGGTLPPGASALVVANRAAFESRHGTGLSIVAEWQQGDRLDNGGERIRLVDANGNTIRDFSYDDSAPWPVRPDGGGPSLVLIAPRSRPDHSLPVNWRSSATSGGNPGASDATTFPGGDRSALLSYATGSVLPLTALPDGNFVFTIELNLAADDVLGVIETSNDLIHWTSATQTMARTAEIPVSDGLTRVSFTTTQTPPFPLFLRYSVSVR